MMKTSRLVALLCAVLLASCGGDEMLTAPAPTNACFNFKDVVGFRFLTNDTSLSSRNGYLSINGSTSHPSGSLNSNGNNNLSFSIQNRFLILNPDNQAQFGPIEWGQDVLLIDSKHNMPLTLDPNTGHIYLQPDRGNKYSRWRIWDQDGAKVWGSRCVNEDNDPSPGSDRPAGSNLTTLITLKSAEVLKHAAMSNTGDLIVSKNFPNGSLDSAKRPTTLEFLRYSDWTGFYYDKPLPSGAGSCEPCPYRGRYDGANCFVVKKAWDDNRSFIYQNNFYNNFGNSTACYLGWYDGANCQLGSNPSGSTPYSYQSGFYLAKSCQP